MKAQSLRNRASRVFSKPAYATSQTYIYCSGPGYPGEDLYRREDKGRRCYLGNITYSIPCPTSYFVPGRVEAKSSCMQLILFFWSSYHPGAKYV